MQSHTDTHIGSIEERWLSAVGEQRILHVYYSTPFLCVRMCWCRVGIYSFVRRTLVYECECLCTSLMYIFLYVKSAASHLCLRELYLYTATTRRTGLGLMMARIHETVRFVVVAVVADTSQRTIMMAVKRKQRNEQKKNTKQNIEANECALITQRKEMKLQIFDPLCVSRLFSTNTHGTHTHVRRSLVWWCAHFSHFRFGVRALRSQSK